MHAHIELLVPEPLGKLVRDVRIRFDEPAWSPPILDAIAEYQRNRRAAEITQKCLGLGPGTVQRLDRQLDTDADGPFGPQGILRRAHPRRNVVVSLNDNPRVCEHESARPLPVTPLAHARLVLTENVYQRGPQRDLQRLFFRYR